MKNESSLHHYNEDIFDSLDGLTKASPGPFFYTRVKARLQKEKPSAWGTIAGFLTRPAVVMATLCTIFLINAGVVFYENESGSGFAVGDQNEQITDDYNTTLAANSYYDDNTDAR